MIGGKEERPGHEVANDCGGLWGVQDEVTELKGNVIKVINPQIS